MDTYPHGTRTLGLAFFPETAEVLPCNPMILSCSCLGHSRLITFIFQGHRGMRQMKVHVVFAEAVCI